jgi:hypothetical protein
MSGLLCRQTLPAGPDGIRRRGSHLHIEHEAPLPYRSVLVSVRPVCPSRWRVACSFKAHLVPVVRSSGLPSVASPSASLGRHRPDRSRKLIGHGGHDDAGGSTLEQFHQPLVDRWDATTERAPWMSKVLRYASPRLLMPSCRTRPPVPVCRGTFMGAIVACRLRSGSRISTELCRPSDLP